MNCLLCENAMRFDHTDENGFAHFVCETDQCQQYGQHVITNNSELVPKQ